MGRSIQVCISVALLLGGAGFAAEDGSGWNQWRGPQRDGSVPGTDWPDDLAGLERMWRVELGKGYPGPIVSEDRVFVVETVDDDTVAVRCLDRSTGQERWRVAWPGSGSVPFFAKANGDWVRSTPAFDGSTLFVGDMTEVLVALDAETGKERWRVDVPKRFGTDPPPFGFASSPLVHGDHLFVQAANSLLKLKISDGSTVWRSLEAAGKMQEAGAFSSPVLAEIHGTTQLVVQTRTTLYGIDPGDGSVLWAQDVPNFRGMNILTPLVHENAVFTSTYREKSFLYRIERNDAGFRAVEAWTNPATGYMSSPVLVDGHAYLHLGNGRLDCIDLASGQSRWRSSSLGSYWSLARQDDKILGLSSDGQLHLVRATPQAFELLDKAPVSEQETWAHLAIQDGEIFVRELEGVVAYRWFRAPKVGSGRNADSAD